VRIPRNISGRDLVKRLDRLGYYPTRQAGSHVRLTTQQSGEYHVTIPLHVELRVGTLNAIVTDTASHLSASKQDIIEILFGDKSPE
jgi:predicted RNA binding protein YcfA (HicA-like mRNA interferase family)